MRIGNCDVKGIKPKFINSGHWICPWCCVMVASSIKVHKNCRGVIMRRGGNACVYRRDGGGGMADTMTQSKIMKAMREAGERGEIIE